MLTVMYVKLFSTIVHSSIWLQDLETKVLWITLMALSDKEGFVFGSVGGMAHASGVPPARTREILDKFMAPDPDSSDLEREPERGGRRIEAVEGGWRLLNAAHYRSIRDAEERREQNREAKARERKRSATVSDGQQKSAPETEADTEPNTDTENPKRERAGKFVSPSVEEVEAYAVEKGLALDAAYFVDFFEAKGWITGKSLMKDWRAAARNAAREGWTNRKATATVTPPTPSGPSVMPSGDIRLPTGGYAAADRSWFDHNGERYFERHPGVYRNGEGFAPDGTSQQNTAYGPGAKEIADRILSAVPVKS